MGIRGYPGCLWSNHLHMTGYPCFRVSIPWVFVGIRGYPFLLAPQGCRSYFRKSAVAGFRGYPGVSVGSGGQISCKSQVTLGSQFLGFSWVSGGIRSFWLPKVPKATSEKRRCCRSSGLHKNNFRQAAVALGFRGYPGVSIGFSG